MSQRNESDSFKKDGIVAIPGFLSAGALAALNAELDDLFSRPSVNGSLYSVYLDRYISEILMPAISVRSVNLLEVALDARDQLLALDPDLKPRDLRLANLELFSEKGNPRRLPWHTDNQKGMFRAIIYIAGGQERSGAFEFMKGTHVRDYHVSHKLNPEQIEKLTPEIKSFVAPAGTLLLFDPNGFHAKMPCVENRRVLMLQFQELDSGYEKSNIFLASHSLTPRVIDNMRFFVNDVSKNAARLGLETHLKENARALPFTFALKALAASVWQPSERRLRRWLGMRPI